MKSTYEFTLNEGPRVKMEKNLGLKVEKKIRGTKTKVDIFIGIKNIFNPIKYDKLL